MTKIEFLQQLSDALSMLPDAERDKALAYYREMLDDRMEDGMSEEEAVNSMDSIESIKQRIIQETPFPVFLHDRIPRWRGWMPTLLAILLFPLWFPLLMAGLGIIFSFYMTIGALIIAAFSVVVGLFLGGVVAIGSGVFGFTFSMPLAIVSIGSGLVLMAIAQLLVSPVMFFARAILRFTRIVIYRIKILFFHGRGGRA